MSNIKRSAEDRQQQQPEEAAASPGDNSPSVTPKDVSSRDASSKDMKERKTASSDPDEREEEMLDDAVDMTFPASDPIAIPVPDRSRGKEKAEKANRNRP